jgi:hypothetical protein
VIITFRNGAAPPPFARLCDEETLFDEFFILPDRTHFVHSVNQ